MATPLTAVTVLVPDRVPPGVPLSATVTCSVKSLSMLPKASVARTTGWVIDTPLIESAGCVAKRSSVAVTSTVVPVPLVTAFWPACIWVPEPPTVKVLSPSTLRM